MARVRRVPTTANLERLAAATDAVRRVAPRRERAEHEVQEAIAAMRAGVKTLVTAGERSLEQDGASGEGALAQ